MDCGPRGGWGREFFVHMAEHHARGHGRGGGRRRMFDGSELRLILLKLIEEQPRHGYDLIRAAHEGFDALLTGEPEEPNLATARELGVHLIAAGHHATERFGVQALAAHLAETFSIEWRYLEVDNPV